MILTIQQWKEILNAVKSSENGVLDAIKEELKRQDQDTYQKWKQKGSDINHLFSVSINNHTQAKELTLLHIAAFNGQLEIVKYLVDEKNVDVNQKCDCLTPLHFAALNGHKDVVTTLLEKGADIANVVNSFLWTPLHLAALNGHKDVVTTLLGKGANVNAADHGVCTPLHLAAEYGHIDAMNALLAAEADVNLQNRGGKTPLRLAVEKERKSAAELLIAHKIKLQGFNPQKPEYLAQHNSNFTREMSEYWDKFLDEIERMKQGKIDQGITLYDILVSKNNRLASFIRNERVMNVLEKSGYKSEFPIYANDLELQFKVGRQRLDDLNIGETVTRHFGVFMGKEGPFNLRIAEYLNNKDLKILKKAAIQTIDEGDCKLEVREEIPKSLSNLNVENLNEVVRSAQRA